MGALALEDIHPSIWRGSQLGSARVNVVPCGFEPLAAELPGGGWPKSALTELLVQQPGVGELRLLLPALRSVAQRRMALLQPPHRFQPEAAAYWGLPETSINVVRASKTADALWAGEQILRAGTFGALLFWQTHVRPEALRRLHLAAQTSDSLFFMVRPLAAASDTSPAPLRIAVRPARDSVSLEFVKRRGPARDEPLVVGLTHSPILLNRHASVDRRVSAAPQPRSLPAELVVHE
ncbi:MULTISPECIES: translesion DNA synthesis-associated protein ImuA [unclassified Caballeronia]|uniref:translesion DNA synthesis-associated protein ImuA n=1 Tax=unclassified Caballeronia TaxID=2646786 RepID=UPI002862AC76|nr:MULTISPECIES: translesion DNA synthesis-associated protein ImuA [unclassified Caballeronia]MDR5754871.1 translesion DNA synthesis-associated protein ImuA [Caballeronia sp. LZ024]MDR5845431.1 translesion DNA synthesis-associated protein ImuA [Caballeronia sp. LZ031]